MSQLRALVWLKWTLFRNALRSRRAAANRVATILGTLAALALSLVVAIGLGIFSFMLTREAGGLTTFNAPPALPGGPTESLGALVILFGILSTIYMMWATVPLSFGGGNQFDPGRFLLYPISLRRLFALDLVSELSSLASIFAVPCVFAIALGVGLGQGRVLPAMLVAACATAFGIALAKLLSTAIGALMQRRRARGETVLALVGAIGGLAGALISQLGPSIAHNTNFLRGVRQSGLLWTPPGLIAMALTEGLRPAGATSYTLALAALNAYTLLIVIVTYRVAQRTVTGTGRARQKARSRAVTAPESAGRYGWQLPFLSAELSAIIEKELRYMARNPQLRVLALMLLFFVFWMRFAVPDRPSAGAATTSLSALQQSAEGWQAALGVLYVFMIISSLSCNLFAYDGAGMRSLILSPVDRRKILIGKNIAVTIVALVFGVAVLIVSQLVVDDLSLQAIIFAALCFVFFAAVFAMVGNSLSVRYPKRLEFGKRMNASGMVGLLLIPLFLGVMLPPAAAVAAGYLTQSLAVKYAILAAFAGAAVMLYSSLITKQGKLLAERERDLLEVVTARNDS